MTLIGREIYDSANGSVSRDPFDAPLIWIYRDQIATNSNQVLPRSVGLEIGRRISNGMGLQISRKICD